MPTTVAVAWGGGKDSALTLYRLTQDRGFRVKYLLATITEDYDRVSMHGVRRSLLMRQAQQVGLPVMEVTIQRQADNAQYERKMEAAMKCLMAEGIHNVAFGDIHLEDVRVYREENLSKVDMHGVFPLWGEDPVQLAREFVTLGFRAVVVCVDSHAIDPSFVGRTYDQSFLDDLPSGVDPCGENGEFHTFVYDGPLFKHRVLFRKGTVVERDGRFYFCDLIPQDK